MSFEAFERIFWAIKYSKAKVIVHSHNAGFGSNAKIHTRILHKVGKLILEKKYSEFKKEILNESCSIIFRW